VAAFVLAGSGLPEALGRRPMGLDLGHCDVLREFSVTDLGGSFTSNETATLSILPKPACKLLIPRESQQVP
jgi:hypothetical protein